MLGIKFSVIIACAHNSDLLAITLKALGELDVIGEFEVIVLDDGTSEGREKEAAHASRQGLPIRYFHLPGVGKSASWNIALRESKGDYLAFLDDDCIPPSGWLKAFESAFDEWTVGIAGGPDRVPEGARIFERCLDYVLTSFIGTLGVRTGSSGLSKYYPRPWNMAARKETLNLSGGFDEDVPEAPEVPMIRQAERIGYKVAYKPDAFIWHLRETNLPKFISRDFRLGRERGRGTSQPRINRTYTMAVFLLILLAVLIINSSTHAFSLRLLQILVGAYTLSLAVSGIHALTVVGLPAVILVPVMIALHHSAHIIGYISGRLHWRSNPK